MPWAVTIRWISVCSGRFKPAGVLIAILINLFLPSLGRAEEQAVHVGIFALKIPVPRAVHRVPEDDYLMSVVQSEMPADWPLEALKAQAVVARTFLYKNRHRHRREGFEVCNLAHCQVFHEAAVIRLRVRAAVQSTRGQTLTTQSRPIEALFHSCCGGKTAASTTLWPGHSLPYLTEQNDGPPDRTFCRASPEFRWRFFAPRAALETLDVTIEQRYPFFLAWGRRFGWHQIKSPFFETQSTPSGVELSGRGLGHGVGLCQWGARGRAEAGQSYREILAHYFPGVVLKNN
jgi:stage II sporulation protein D